MVTLPLAAFILAYLIGSVPFGFVLGLATGLGDIRKAGSGNIGATNMWRLGGAWRGILTLTFDMAKGVLAIYLTELFIAPEMKYYAAAGAILGHMFPLWLKFHGGKGVATTLGTLFYLEWTLGAFAILMWLFMFNLFRISSLSALTAMALACVYALFLTKPEQVFWFMLAVTAMIFIKHAPNIRRLFKGEEKPLIVEKTLTPVSEAKVITRLAEQEEPTLSTSHAPKKTPRFRTE